MKELRGTLFAASLFAASFAVAVDFDNFINQNSVSTGKHSALFTYDEKIILDRQFAGLFENVFYKNGEYNVKNAAFMFNQCYGGGMIDELVGNYGNIDMALGSAARHDQMSWSLNNPGDRDFGYSEWTHVMYPHLPGKTYVEAMFEAFQTDQFGPILRPSPPKKHASGVEIAEDPQFTWTREGRNAIMTEAESFHAILWAGKADKRSYYNDIDRMHYKLTQEWSLTGKPFTITVLFNDGLKNSQGDALPAEWNARAATWINLQDAVDELRPRMNANEQFLFYSSDHGSLWTEVVKTRTEIPTTSTGLVLNLRLDEGEINGMVVEPLNQPELLIDYQITGQDAVDVYLGSTLVGQLLPGSTQQTLLLDESLFLGRLRGPSFFDLRFVIGGSSTAFIDYAGFGLGGVGTGVDVVPEPASLAALSAGLAALIVRRRRR